MGQGVLENVPTAIQQGVDQDHAGKGFNLELHHHVISRIQPPGAADPAEFAVEDQ